ncbi:MAG: hypothetical protein FWH37_06020 [Candidatus Bathyarchaeota archaeon]|nr:hypothetical protein [Candidatus Termiticorpusculum sp.]
MVKKITSCSLIILFLLTTFTIIDIKPTTVSAINTSITWGNLNNYAFNSTEFPKQAKVCQAVNSMFYGSWFWLPADSYGYYTQPAYVYDALEKVADPYKGVDYTHVFWVGDYNPSLAANTLTPYGQLGLFTNVTGSYVWDNEIYPRTTAYGDSKHYFTFMWTCVNGGLYWNNNVWQNVSGITWPAPAPYYGTPPPPYYFPPPPNYPPNNPCTGYSASNSTHMVGMPLAWTGTAGMSIDGHNNPSGDYTFIGWENTSPFMGNKPTAYYTSYPDLEYSHFIYYFYVHATNYTYGQRPTINEALDCGAEMAFGKKPGSYYSFDFDSSVLNMGEWWHPDGNTTMWLYCRLRVLGNGDMRLPP